MFRTSFRDVLNVFVFFKILFCLSSTFISLTFSLSVSPGLNIEFSLHGFSCTRERNNAIEHAYEGAGYYKSMEYCFLSKNDEIFKTVCALQLLTLLPCELTLLLNISNFARSSAPSSCNKDRPAVSAPSQTWYPLTGQAQKGQLPKNEHVALSIIVRYGRHCVWAKRRKNEFLSVCWGSPRGVRWLGLIRPRYG